MAALRRLVLDDAGNCVAEEAKPGVWHIHRTDPFNKKHTVILTSDTIKYLAGVM